MTNLIVIGTDQGGRTVLPLPEEWPLDTSHVLSVLFTYGMGTTQYDHIEQVATNAWVVSYGILNELNEPVWASKCRLIFAIEFPN